MECGSWKTEPSNWIDAEVASLIEKETFKKRISNNEYRMSNIEGRHSIDFY